MLSKGLVSGSGRLVWIGCGVAGLLLGGCLGAEGDASDGDPAVRGDVAEIVTGPNTVDDTDVNPQWPEVVQVCGGGACCSGTVISPVHILTAGHCQIPAGGTVRLDTPAGGGSGSGRRAYSVIQAKTRSSAVASGNDLMLLVLDQAIPSFGIEGAPEYSVKPAFAFAGISNTVSTWTVGYGYGNDCVKTNAGIRRGLRYLGGFSTYAAFPGVITRANLPCDDINKGPSPGDSGGPLLDVFGRVVGVFSGWSCRTSTGSFGGACSGTIEWTGLSTANATWLNDALAGDFDGDGISDKDDPRPGLNCTGASPPAACASLKPDFQVTSIVSGGCTGSGGDPEVKVTVRNNGPLAGSTWVDVFTDLGAAPTVGTFSTNFRMSNALHERETQDMWFVVTPASNPTWVDVIVDTTRSRDELNETNNVSSARVTLPDCSFN